MFPVGAFFIGVGATTAIATVLAIIMVIADATIANYGDVNLTVNDSRELTVKGGQPLLGALKEQGIFIPSACGGRGSCGLCKVAVESGAGEISPTEIPWLNVGERAKGTRLSCQLKVKRPMAVRIPEELFSIREYATEVASIRDLTYDIKEVSLRLKEPAVIELSAGKYVQFVVPAYELTPDPVYRAYSVASAPSSKNAVELEIRLVPNGICTTYVFTRLKVGDAVTINGPYGEFYLRDSDRDIIFVAGGSGMAPIKSMLLDMAGKESTRKATYFFGARAVRDLFLIDEMKELEKKLPNFRFVAALSNPLPEDKWQGETGLITEVLDRNFSALDRHEAYLCGSPGMIDASIKVLKSKGLPEDMIFFDKFA